MCAFEGRYCVCLKLCKAHCKASQTSRHYVDWESGDLSPFFGVVSRSVTLNKSFSHLETWFCYFKIKGVGLDDLVLWCVVLGLLIFGEK